MCYICTASINPTLFPVYEREYYASIRFHINSVCRIEFPFARVDSVNCLHWFKLAANATAVEKSSKEVKCIHCKRLVLDLECQKRRTTAESSMRKIKWQSVSSRAMLTYMFPASQQKRQQNCQYAQNVLNSKLMKYKESNGKEIGFQQS